MARSKLNPDPYADHGSSDYEDRLVKRAAQQDAEAQAAHDPSQPTDHSRNGDQSATEPSNHP